MEYLTDSNFEIAIYEKHTPINSYNPVVCDNNITMFTVCSSLDGVDIYTQKLSEKNIYLYELRTFLDSISLIEKNSDKEFLLEIPLSISTIFNGLFLKYISNKVTAKVNLKRITLSVIHNFKSKSEKHDVLSQLKIFKKLGYSTMIVSQKHYLDYDYFIGDSDWAKVDLSYCNLESKEHFIKLFISILGADKVIFDGINNQNDKQIVFSCSGKYLQGKGISKTQKALISGEFTIR